ncbi:MAG: response regulator, partial [Desulfobulbaceae bacterium]|nr:response regulator [Desulfobulbaceae bacterium]
MSNANLTVLVVDDAASVQKLIKPVLRKELGFLSDNILEAYDGKKALNILKTNKVNLILAEWNIPELSGIDLLKRVRQDSAFSLIPFVMVSS